VKQHPTRIPSLPVLLCFITLMSVRTMGPFPLFTSATPAVSTSFSPPFNETIPMPIPLTISFGYGLAPAGPQSVFVLCAEFTNVNHTKTRSETYDIVFNKVSQYFREVSYSKISLTGSVSRWYQMNKTVGAYGRDSALNIDDPNGDGSPDSWALIQEAIDAADPEVDFSQYSYLMILHAGSGQETSGNPNDIWSCAYLMGIWFKTKDGVSFSKAMIVPEIESQGADTVGVVAHEFAHLLGLPDLYDPYRRSDYVGRWELMGKGLWNGNPPSSSPAHMIAWEKIRLGWVSESQIVVVPSGVIRNVTISPLELDGTTLVVKIPITDRTYYLVELRQRIGFDIGLPDSGLLVTYVDGEISGAGSIRVIDANPLTATMDDAAFKPGRTFSDQTNKIYVSILGTSEQSYRLVINRVGPASDLAVIRLDLSPYPLRAGRVTTLSTYVTNQGTATALNFTVEVYLDGKLFYTNTYTLEPGQSQSVQLTWNATFGKHVIRCVVDSAGRLSELNRYNNEITREFVVGSVLSVRLPWVGGSIRVNGTMYAANGTTAIEVPILPGQQTIEAPYEHLLSSGRRQVFVRWSDGDSSNPRIYYAVGDVALSAEYKTQYRLTIDSGKGTTSGDGWYDENSTATAKATSPVSVTEGKTRLVFSHWSGNYTSNSTTLQLSMNRPYNLTANWVVEHYLTIVSAVGPFAEQGWYREGAEVRLKAPSVVDQGNRTRRAFINWSGDLTSESTEITLMMTRPRAIIANWKTEYELRILSDHGKPSGQGWIPAGTTARLSIEPMIDAGAGVRYVFTRWTGDYDGAFCETSVMMDRPRTLTATWRTQYLVGLIATGLPNGTSVTVRVNSKWRNGTMPFDFSEWVDAGSEIILEAPAEIQAGADQYVFQTWRSSDGQPIDLPQTVNSPKRLELVYVKKPKGLLKILLATYDQDRFPELSLIKAARERHIPKTFAGKHWSDAFDQVFHSLAPNLSESIGESQTLKMGLAALFYPTLKILAMSASAYLAIGPASDVAFFAAGFISSALVGIVYLTPPFLLAFRVTRKRRPRLGRNLAKYIGLTLLIAAELVVFGEVTRAPITTTTATFIFLIASTCLSGIAATLAIYSIGEQIKARRLAKIGGFNSKTLMGLPPDVSDAREVSQ